MDRIFNALKGQAASLDQMQGQPRFAVVTNVDPAKYTARVLLQPEGVLTGWLPILSQWVGAGWGLVAPPVPGEQVLVLAQEGDAEHGVIVGRAFSDAAPAPGGGAAVPGELWLVHRGGAYLKLRNDGSIEGNAAVWHLVGDVHVQGDIYDFHGKLDDLRQHYNAHRHPPPSGAPSPQD